MVGEPVVKAFFAIQSVENGVVYVKVKLGVKVFANFCAQLTLIGNEVGLTKEVLRLGKSEGLALPKLTLDGTVKLQVLLGDGSGVTEPRF